MWKDVMNDFQKIFHILNKAGKRCTHYVMRADILVQKCSTYDVILGFCGYFDVDN